MTFQRPLFSLHTTSPAELTAVKQIIESLRADVESALNDLSNTTANNLETLDTELRETLTSEVNRLTNIINALDEATANSIASLDGKVDDHHLAINSRLTSVAEAIRSELANVNTELNSKLNAAVETLNGRIDSTNSTLLDYRTANDQRSTEIEADIEALLDLVGTNDGNQSAAIADLNMALRSYIVSEDDKVKALVSSLTSSVNDFKLAVTNEFARVDEDIVELDTNLRTLVENNALTAKQYTDQRHQQAVDEIILTSPDIAYGEQVDIYLGQSEIDEFYDVEAELLYTYRNGGWVAKPQTRANTFTPERWYLNTRTKDMYYSDDSGAVTRVERFADRYLTIGKKKLLLRGGENTFTLAEIGALPADDASVTNAREWTAETITQLEAEKGTLNTRMAFTALRVRQAIDAATAKHLRETGGTISSGDLTFTRTLDGIRWRMNTDGGGVRFKSEGDNDTDSYLEFYTEDNDNEYFRWAHKRTGSGALTPYMTLKTSGLDLLVGKYTGNGSGLTNLSAEALVGKVPEKSLPAKPSVEEAEAGSVSELRMWSPALVRKAIEAYTKPGTIHNPIELGNTENLDDLTTPNVYRQQLNANTSLARGYPEDKAGALRCYYAAGIIQEYLVYGSSRVYTRAKYTGANWTSWAKQYNTTNKPSLEELSACADDDERLSNAREWDASTISKEEAETGTSNTRRAFTAVRVREAIRAVINDDKVLKDGGEYKTVTFSDWVRCTGNNGLYFASHGGGVHMTDTTWVRVSHSKKLYVNNDIASTQEVISKYSDERLKENVEAIEGALDIVRKWSCVRYNANSIAEKLGGYDRSVREVGFLAGEIKATVPEIITLAPFDMGKDSKSKSGENYLTVNYAKTTPILAKAIQEIDKVLESKTNKIDELEQRIARLEQLIK